MSFTDSQLGEQLALLIAAYHNDTTEGAQANFVNGCKALFSAASLVLPTQLAEALQGHVDITEQWIVQYRAWAAGQVDGGPNSDGHYEIVDRNGSVTTLPCPARIQADLYGIAPRGSLETVADLDGIESPSVGDLYVTLDTGEAWVFAATAAWVNMGPFRGLSVIDEWRLLPGNEEKTAAQYFQWLADAQKGEVQPLLDEAISASETAVAAKDVAVSARDEAVSSSEASVAASVAAIAARGDAVAAKDDAVAAKDDAVVAKDDAVAASDTAVSAKNDAVSAKDDAVAAKGDAEVASATSVSAKDDAVAASDTAVSAKDDAVAASAAAVAAKNDAEAASAQTALDVASTTQDAATAVAARDAAIAARDAAQEIAGGDFLTNADALVRFAQLGAPNAFTAQQTFSENVTLLAGTASGPVPLSFQAGVLKDAPAPHSVEWDGSRLHVTTGAGVRHAVAFAAELPTDFYSTTAADQRFAQLGATNTFAQKQTFSGAINVASEPPASPTHGDIWVGTSGLEFHSDDATATVFTTLAGTLAGTLTLLAGTASGPVPLSFQAASALRTEPVPHGVEWDGSRVHVTDSTSGRNALAYLGDIPEGGVTSVAGLSGAVTAENLKDALGIEDAVPDQVVLTRENGLLTRVVETIAGSTRTTQLIRQGSQLVRTVVAYLGETRTTTLNRTNGLLTSVTSEISSNV